MRSLYESVHVGHGSVEVFCPGVQLYINLTMMMTAKIMAKMRTKTKMMMTAKKMAKMMTKTKLMMTAKMMMITWWLP